MYKFPFKFLLIRCNPFEHIYVLTYTRRTRTYTAHVRVQAWLVFQRLLLFQGFKSSCSNTPSLNRLQSKTWKYSKTLPATLPQSLTNRK